VPWEDLIKARAAGLGFDLVGITSAQPPARIEFYRRWIAENLHGEMAYLARHIERRADPAALLPGAQSIVVVACSSHTTPPAPSPLQGKVARYALGEDYHDVMRHKLDALVAAIRELAPQAQARASVDTSAVLERELAQRAGLGWIGKNTMLFNNRFGQWLLLGEILLTLPLQPDPPETRDRCGRCTRCMDACPTRAIVAPRLLDARRCVSYLTIELKGAIPVELRPLVGHRIFGCDDCLEVCPWNRFARQAREAAFTPRRDLVAPDLVALLEELLAMDEAAFRRRFAGSPLFRAKRPGLLRNVCVALGNTRDPRAVPALTRALADAEPLAREHAAWALERIATQDGKRDPRQVPERGAG